MALPVIEAPKYALKIPSTGDMIEYRPFLVKEEKILLIAKEEENDKSLIRAMRDIIDACTFNKLDLYKLAMYDLEYIFLNLRAKSVGETAQIQLEGSDGEFVPVEVDLTKVEVVSGQDRDNKIEITSDVGITLKAPGLKDMERASNSKDVITESIISIIDTIYDASEVYPAADSSPKELTAFVDSLTHGQLEEIKDWMEDMPRLEHTISYEAKNGKKRRKDFKGLRRFFRVALSHINLENYYQVQFSMAQHHKYSLTELDNLIPWEREIYVGLLKEHLKEEKEREQRNTNYG
jgi:hypothetical protein